MLLLTIVNLYFWPTRQCVRYPRWRYNTQLAIVGPRACVRHAQLGHCSTSGNLLCVKICSPQYFGITRRYMQKKLIFGRFFCFVWPAFGHGAWTNPRPWIIVGIALEQDRNINLTVTVISIIYCCLKAEKHFCPLNIQTMQTLLISLQELRHVILHTREVLRKRSNY